MNNPESKTRLQVYLAKRGVASRRACAEIILDGRVQVNGKRVCEPGFRVTTDMHITLDGQELPHMAEPIRSIVMYKPRGYICSHKLQSTTRNLGTVYDLIEGIPEKLNTVGRLDKDSEGLIVLSNDGQLNETLAHPRFGHSKTYLVTVIGTVSSDVITGLRSCRSLDKETIQPVDISIAHVGERNTVIQFVLREGRNRQIRRMCRLFDLRVERLVRTRIGNFDAPTLLVGQWRDLLPQETALLTTEW
jgi:23S rRNA pseudouridine2605 synthase